MSELPEALPAFLTKSILTALNKHAAIIESLHVSDQYTGFVERWAVPGVRASRSRHCATPTHLQH